MLSIFNGLFLFMFIMNLIIIYFLYQKNKKVDYQLSYLKCIFKSMSELIIDLKCFVDSLNKDLYKL